MDNKNILLLKHLISYIDEIQKGLGSEEVDRSKGIFYMTPQDHERNGKNWAFHLIKRKLQGEIDLIDLEKKAQQKI